MKVELLQSEFLRLSDQYPEIRHAIVSGDKNWRFVQPPSDDTRIFGDGPIKVLSDRGLNEDRFARVYCLWIGAQDRQREYSAENEFNRLAQLTSECVPLGSLKSHGGPVQAYVVAGDGIAPAPKDSLEIGISMPRIPRVSKWVSHVIVANGVLPCHCRASSNGVIGLSLVRVLTIDSFRASAFALGSSAADQENDPPKGNPDAAAEVDGEGNSRQINYRPPGSAQELILGALQTHHGYKTGGGCTNFEPIGGNKLAELAGVGQGSPTTFWKAKFSNGDREGEYGDYQRSCVNGKIGYLLEVWSGEASGPEALQLMEEEVRRRANDDD